MFHQNKKDTTGGISFVSQTAYVKHRLFIYIFDEIIPFFKKNLFFTKLKMSNSVECNRKLVLEVNPETNGNYVSKITEA